jgi:DNA-binding transcriptional MerR regulator/DNA gyrase inhibitor GyrI
MPESGEAMSEENIQLLSIGAVARATTLTVKALRHYHEIGLLVPRSVDEWTGYRSYGPAELATASMIANLRTFDLPLAEMSIVLADPTSEAARECLRRHRERLEHRAAQVDSSLARLDAFLEGRSEMEYPSTLTPPTIRTANSRAAWAIETTTTIEKIAEVIPDLFKRVAGAVQAAGVAPSGPFFARYLDNPQSGDPFRMQVGAPIASGEVPAGLVAVTLPGGQHVVAEHQGNYDSISAAWAALFRWVIDRGDPIDGGPWEEYLTTPMDSNDPADWRTALVFPLA